MKMFRRQSKTPYLAEHIWWFTTRDTRLSHVRLNYSKRHPRHRPIEFILLERFGGGLGITGHIPLSFPHRRRAQSTK